MGKSAAKSKQSPPGTPGGESDDSTPTSVLIQAPPAAQKSDEIETPLNAEEIMLETYELLKYFIDDQDLITKPLLKRSEQAILDHFEKLKTALKRK